MNNALSRSLVESVVRQVVLERISFRLGTSQHRPKLVVNVSSRHMHITQEHLDALFGPNAALSVERPLYQEDFFAAEQTVTLVGPKGRIISGLRILGPLRNYTQVEIAYTDAIMLGFENVPARLAGDIDGSPGAVIVGPKGVLELKKGIIRSAPHVHMSPADAEYYGVKNKDLMKVRIGGESGVVFAGIVARVDKASRLEVHLDTDEANACGLHRTKKVELYR